MHVKVVIMTILDAAVQLKFAFYNAYTAKLLANTTHDFRHGSLDIHYFWILRSHIGTDRLFSFIMFF